MGHFRKGFRAVLFHKIYCYQCKRKILANALKCPYCLTDMMQAGYRNFSRWQKLFSRVMITSCLLLTIILFICNIPWIIAAVIALCVYGAGCYAADFIQSIRNFFY